MSSILPAFNRDPSIPADWKEEGGNLFLGLFRVAGNGPIWECKNATMTLTFRTNCLGIRILSGLMAIALLPITLIGVGLTKWSKTYSEALSQINGVATSTLKAIPPITEKPTDKDNPVQPVQSSPFLVRKNPMSTNASQPNVSGVPASKSTLQASVPHVDVKSLLLSAKGNSKAILAILKDLQKTQLQSEKEILATEDTVVWLNAFEEVYLSKAPVIADFVSDFCFLYCQQGDQGDNSSRRIDLFKWLWMHYTPEIDSCLRTHLIGTTPKWCLIQTEYDLSFAFHGMERVQNKDQLELLIIDLARQGKFTHEDIIVGAGSALTPSLRRKLDSKRRLDTLAGDKKKQFKQIEENQEERVLKREKRSKPRRHDKKPDKKDSQNPSIVR